MTDLNPSNYWPLGSTVQETKQVELTSSYYEHFGFISVNPIDGHMVIIYRKATSHVGTQGTIWLRNSTDGGVNWSIEILLFSESSIDLRNLGGGYTNDGRLFLFYARYDYDAIPSPVWSTMNFRYSDDNGQNWSSQQTLSTESQTWFSPHGQLVDAGNNVIYQTWYAGTGSTYKLYLYKSTNGNDNPPTFSVIEIYSGSIQYTESSLVNLGGGIFILLTRNNGSWYFHQFKTEDNCQSWSSQGDTSFEQLGGFQTPPWLSFINYEGVGIIACYYSNRATQKLNVVFGLAKYLIDNGPNSWNNLTIKEVYDYNGTLNSGYQSFFLPYNQYKGIGLSFKEVSSSVAYPVIVFTKISGMNNVLSTLGL